MWGRLQVQKNSLNVASCSQGIWEQIPLESEGLAYTILYTLQKLFKIYLDYEKGHPRGCWNNYYIRYSCYQCTIGRNQTIINKNLCEISKSAHIKSFDRKSDFSLKILAPNYPLHYFKSFEWALILNAHCKVFTKV